MLKSEKEVAQAQLKAEKAVLKEIEAQYKQALDDIDEKIASLLGRNDADMQNVIYQVQYQKQLKTQVQSILEQLQANEFETISQFLTQSYTDGYVGAMYTMHSQGVPIISPIDQNAVIKAIQTDSKLNHDLYTELGVDITKLKKSVTSEITRGVATGMMYDEIARNISLTTKAPLSRTKTIVRTEAHRIQQASAHDAYMIAKSKGADVVKQWDSTLDGDTRPTHQQLDGQIVELEEPFKVAGKKAMYPGDFGDPAQDCNCRCRVNQRAKWALGKEELQTLKDRAEYFGLDKSKELKEFKNKYLKAAKTLENTTKSGIIKPIKVDDVTTAINGGTIQENVAKRVAEVLNNLNALTQFDRVETRKLGSVVAFQTEPQKVGTFFDTVLVMNEEILGGKTVEEIDAIFANAKKTVCNSLDDAVVHETYHAKLIHNLNYAQLEGRYDELNDVHIDGISATAMVDGAECIAEVGVLIKRGETADIPKEAMELFERFLGGT